MTIIQNTLFSDVFLLLKIDNPVLSVLLDPFLIGGVLSTALFLSLFLRERAHRKEFEREHAKIDSEYKNAGKNAMRIVSTILPPAQKAGSILGEHFIFNRQKRVVGGDFYWIEKVQGKSMLAVIDCTGHGIPGVLMSLIAHEGLSKAIFDYELTRPDKILSALNEHLSETIQKTGSIDIKDGLDLGLCVLNADRSLLEFSGAKNSLFLVRKKGKLPETENEIQIKETHSEDFSLYEIKSDRKSVEPSNTYQEFTTIRIKTEKGDSLYLMTDGFSDQFGGEEMKKFGAKRLREAILDMQDSNMNEQNTRIQEIFTEWKSDNEQIDDITIVGMKI